MLNGLYPIVIFNFSKLLPSVQDSIAKIPVVSSIVEKVGLPPIPIYLDEELTGLAIASEEKSIEIQSTTETKTSGETPDVNQKGLSSTVSVTLEANQDSLGLTLFSALADQLFEKVTSKEYSVTYLSGATTVFNGLLGRFSISKVDNTNKYLISFEIIRNGLETQPKPTNPVIERLQGGVNLAVGQ